MEGVFEAMHLLSAMIARRVGPIVHFPYSDSLPLSSSETPSVSGNKSSGSDGSFLKRRPYK